MKRRTKKLILGGATLFPTMPLLFYFLHQYHGPSQLRKSNDQYNLQSVNLALVRPSKTLAPDSPIVENILNVSGYEPGTFEKKFEMCKTVANGYGYSVTIKPKPSEPIHLYILKGKNNRITLEANPILAVLGSIISENKFNIEGAKKIRDWVNGRLDGRSTWDVSSAGPTEVLKTRRGACMETAYITASILKSCGINAKIFILFCINKENKLIALPSRPGQPTGSPMWFTHAVLYVRNETGQEVLIDSQTPGSAAYGSLEEYAASHDFAKICKSNSIKEKIYGVFQVKWFQEKELPKEVVVKLKSETFTTEDLLSLMNSRREKQ